MVEKKHIFIFTCFNTPVKTPSELHHDFWYDNNKLVGLLDEKVRYVYPFIRHIGTASLPVATEVTCLGVVFDSELTFSKHVKSVVRRCFYHLRQLRTVRKSLTTESVKTLVQALIASRLDYCNRLAALI